MNDPVTVTADITVKALWEDAPPAPVEYTVTVTTEGNGTASASPAKAVAGEEITLTATPDGGYRFKEWEVISGGVTIKNNKFTMPDNNVEVKAIFEEDTPPAPTEHTVTVTSGGNGTASASPAKAAAGAEITLSAAPDKGYHLKEWQVESPAGLVITNNKFTMPDGNVDVKAIFEKDAPPAPTEFIVTFDGNGGTPSVGSMTTTDRKLTSLPSASRSGSYSFYGWYSERSLTNKVSGVYLTKDMTVYALWRVDENPNTGANPFTDVSEKDWFYGDVMFVYEN